MQKGYENRYQIAMISIEELVPQDHLLRQISEAVDFSKIYEFVEELYCNRDIQVCFLIFSIFPKLHTTVLKSLDFPK